LCFGYFGDRVLLFAQDGLDRDSSVLHSVAGMTGTCYHAQLAFKKTFSYSTNEWLNQKIPRTLYTVEYYSKRKKEYTHY
jgi:hypothetical protein